MFLLFRFQVQGYPTIKFFRAGNKDFSSAEDFQGGRTASDIVAFALELHAAAVEPPEIIELTSNKILEDNCNEKPLCVISFLPDILDSQAAGRNGFLKVLRELGDKYKAKMWGWVWTAAAAHPKLEESLGIGGFGYPAMAVVNIRKKVLRRCLAFLFYLYCTLVRSHKLQGSLSQQTSTDRPQ